MRKRWDNQAAETRRCANCRDDLPLSEFSPKAKTCTPCLGWMRTWNDSHPAAVLYERLLNLQNGRCAICKRRNDGTRKFAVDHCHETGFLRGLLCASCNMGLGQFRDDVEVLKAAIRYVERFRDLHNEMDL